MFKESETLELKKTTSELKEAVVSISAMLNKHGGGELLFGIKNDGAAAGQPISDKTIRGVSQAISDHIEPKIYPVVEEKCIDGKKCIHVSFHGESAPYFAYGRAYLRVGDENRQMSARELEGLILKKNKETIRWDNKVCKNATYSDISVSKLRAFLGKAGLEFDSAENSLRKLMLSEDGKLFNASVLLFAEKPQEFFPNAKLRCAVFGPSETIDMQDYEGDLFYLIEEAQKYVLKNIHIGMRIDGLVRIDVPEIDKEALREAIINAFCHRDYHMHDSVNIAVFSDRVEIRSPGLLYGGLTLERMVNERVSERRNELIADLLHRVHLIEKWGRGVELILSKEPKTFFKEVGRQFITVFPRKEGATQKTSQKSTRKVPEKYQKLIDAAINNPQASRKELAEMLGESKGAIQSRLRKLAKKGILKHVGPDKGGHWEIIKE